MSTITHNILKLVFWLSLTATVYTYFLYPLLLMAICRLRRSCHTDVRDSDHPLPRVTMVISAYNEELVLPGKIANCRAIDYPADKITFLIGSDGSDDETAGILHRIDDKRFRTIHVNTRSGKVGMINRLMKMATGQIVVFSDANTMYKPDAIRHIVQPFEQSDVGCVNGKLLLTTLPGDSDSCRPEGLYWRYENSIKQMESITGSVPTINGGMFAIRRGLFEQLPSNAVTEDQVLGMKIMVRGYRCLFAGSAIASETVSDWKGELRRRIRISAGNFQSLFMVPGILNPRLGWTAFAFFSHKLLRWLVPFFLVAVLLANIMLAGRPFYGSTLLLQGLFYLGGLLGTAMPKLGMVPKALAIPKYFIVMNVAIILGLLRFVTRRQRTTWVKTQRH